MQTIEEVAEEERMWAAEWQREQNHIAFYGTREEQLEAQRLDALIAEWKLNETFE